MNALSKALPWIAHRRDIMIETSWCNSWARRHGVFDSIGRELAPQGQIGRSISQPMLVLLEDCVCQHLSLDRDGLQVPYGAVATVIINGTALCSWKGLYRDDFRKCYDLAFLQRQLQYIDVGMKLILEKGRQHCSEYYTLCWIMHCTIRNKGAFRMVQLVILQRNQCTASTN